MRPNVLLIVADDLGWADVGFRGSQIRTPALDQIARQGVVLDRLYTAPICSPTRAALMTGRDPIRLGLAYGVVAPWHNGGLDPTEHLMPESFAAAGYQTAMVGKWHLGHALQALRPNARGFGSFYGHMNTEVDYNDKTVLGARDFQRDGQSVSDSGHLVDLHGEETIRRIRDRDKERPFFIYLAFTAPHSPFQPRDDILLEYADVDNEIERRYSALVHGMDRAIGRVLAAIEDEGIADDTIVVFLSDHGASWPAGRNDPLRGGKGTTFEGGIRVVSMIVWPREVAPSTTFGGILSAADIFPTLCTAAGIATQGRRPLDGLDMWNDIRAGSATTRSRTLFFGCQHIFDINYYAALTTGDPISPGIWKLVEVVDQGPTDMELKRYLFRVDINESETHDYWAEKADLARSLGERLASWRATHPLNGLRSSTMAPPGWRPPRDWAYSGLPDSEVQMDVHDAMATRWRVSRRV